MELAPYTVGGKTAPEYYETAKIEFGKKYLINTIDAMQLANECLHPNDMWQYPQEAKIIMQYTAMLNAANSTYQFPLIFTSVATHPAVFSIINQSFDGERYLTVSYMSKIKLTDTIGIKQENASIRNIIGAIFPGIDKDKKCLVYCVYNEKPSSMKSVDHFDIVDHIR